MFQEDPDSDIIPRPDRRLSNATLINIEYLLTFFKHIPKVSKILWLQESTYFCLLTFCKCLMGVTSGFEIRQLHPNIGTDPTHIKKFKPRYSAQDRLLSNVQVS